MPTIISREEAIAKGLNRYFTGKPCKHGHVSERCVRDGNRCITCKRIKRAPYRERANELERIRYSANPKRFIERTKKWAINNPERAKENKKKWNLANPEYSKKYSRKYYAMNPERVIGYVLKHHSKNKDRLKAAARAWVLANPHIINERVRKRTAMKRRAVPAWYDKTSVKKIYLQASWLSLATGIPHQVDHIVPLKNKLVCGLHCADNLQILTKTENTQKGNRFKI